MCGEKLPGFKRFVERRGGAGIRGRTTKRKVRFGSISVTFTDENQAGSVVQTEPAVKQQDVDETKERMGWMYSRNRKTRGGKSDVSYKHNVA